MTQTAPQRTRRPAPGYLVLAVIFCCALVPGRAAGQRENSLEQVALGDGQGYSRLAFTFREPLGPYTVKTEPGGLVLVDLGPMRLGDLGALPRHEVITGLDFETRDGRLLAQVRVSLAGYDLKHLTGRDRYTLNLDVMPPAAPEPPAMPGELGRDTLALPTLAEVALEQSRLSPPGPHDGPDEHLFQRILGEVAIDNRSAAQGDLDFFFKTFPGHPRSEVASYLKAELDFLAGPPEETYAAATEAWKSFLDRWPHSALSSRAHYKLAEADLKLNFNNEAAGQFAYLAGERDDVYSRRALLKAADLYMDMGLVDEARKVLTPVLNQGVADRLGWEVYARAGAADFYQGFHSQAADTISEALRQVPDLHETFPESLYALGEAYHYLGRPDLSRHYLTQAVNLIPDHSKADITLTRIGDNYRQEGLDREAIAVYGAVRRNFPRQEGGLISQVRLADMGSLHSFFSQEKVFEALERGSRQATVEMYKSIMDSGFSSPLLQLAQLKIGTALAEDGAANEAIRWLRDLEINNPKSPLLSEALPVLNSALVDQMTLFRDMDDWQGIVDLYADNSYYFAAADRSRMEALVAQGYERLGRFREARETWAELVEEAPDKRLARARGLVVNSLKIGQPQEALKYILEMEAEFPEQRRWLDDQLALVGRALARPHNPEAVTNLLDLRRVISSEPVRRDALSDVITIEIDGRRYDRAVTFIKQYRQEYPLDELSQEYLLTLAQIADYQKRPEDSWDLLSQFRQSYPEDQRGRQLLLGQIEKADSLRRPEDAFRFIDLYRGLYHRDPESASLLIEKMNRLWEAGRLDEAWEALVSFTREYPEDPRRPGVMLDYLERDWEKGRDQEARGLLAALLAGHRDRPELLDLILKRADLSWGQGRYDEARELTALILANYPGEGRLADLLLKQADRSWTQGRYDEARELTALIRANYPGDGRLADLLLKQADLLWTRERYAEARGLTSFIRTNYPGDGRLADLLLKQADRSWSQGRYAEARGLTAFIQANYPGDGRLADLLFKQADQSWTQERYDESQELAALIQANYPGDGRLADLLLRRAEGNWGRGRFEAAREDWSGFRRAFPENEQVGRSYIDQYRKMVAAGLASEAFQLAEEYRGLRPQDVALQADLMLEQAKDYFALSRPDEGLAMWNSFRQTFPQDGRNADLLLIQARRELKSGLEEEALGHYRQFLAQYPKDQRQADVYLETAAAEVGLNQRAEAWERLSGYITAFPAHEGRYQAILDAVDLGRSLGRLPETVGLLEILRRDYPNSPSAPGAFLAEARLRLTMGDQAGAVSTLENGVLSRLEVDSDPQVQALLTELYLEEGRVEDWAAQVEKNLNRAEKGPAPSNRFQKYYQLAQVYQELGRNPDVERNLDSALANRDAGVSAENLYAVAQGYKRLLRSDKYRSTLLLVRETNDPFWQKVAADELAAGTSG